MRYNFFVRIQVVGLFLLLFILYLVLYRFEIVFCILMGVSHDFFVAIIDPMSLNTLILYYRKF